MELTTAKALAMLALGLGSFITGMIPAAVSESSRQRHPLFLSCLLCFGGGVLLSTSMVHMLPEAREKLPNLSELMLCAGFFLVYLVDEIVHFFNGVHRNVRNSDYGSTETTSLLAARSADGEMRACSGGDGARPGAWHAACGERASGALALVAALLVHSALEGLAIGLQESASQVLLLMGAVASHKYVVGFCLGAEICGSSPNRLCLHIVCVLLFSGGSVAGIALGAGLEAVSAVKDSAAVPIMQALAAGTLLYVTVSEVLPRERAKWHERRRSAGIAQFTSVALGFGLMYLITKYLDHDAV